MPFSGSRAKGAHGIINISQLEAADQAVARKREQTTLCGPGCCPDHRHLVGPVPVMLEFEPETGPTHPIIVCRKAVFDEGGREVLRVDETEGVILYPCMALCSDGEKVPVLACQCEYMVTTCQLWLGAPFGTAAEVKAAARCYHALAIDKILDAAPLLREYRDKLLRLPPVRSLREARYGVQGALSTVDEGAVISACLSQTITDNMDAHVLFGKKAYKGCRDVVHCMACEKHNCMHVKQLKDLAAADDGDLLEGWVFSEDLMPAPLAANPDEADDTTTARAFVSTRPRRLHSRSVTQQHRHTSKACYFLLPTCYWCKAVRAEVKDLQAKVAGVTQPLVPFVPPKLPDAIAQHADRALLDTLLMGTQAAKVLGLGTQARWQLDVYWDSLQTRVASGLREAVAAEAFSRGVDLQVLASRRAADLVRQAREAADAAASAWMNKQQLAWKHRPVADQLRLWAKRAMLGDRCRHCVDDPTPHPCPRCSAPLEADPVGANRLATKRPSWLYGTVHCERVQVYERRCTDPECDLSLPFDGLDCGVANYTNVTLFCEEVLRRFYLDLIKQKGLTLASYWERMQGMYGDAAGGGFMDRTHFRLALKAYLGLLDNKQGAAFKCPICSRLPHDQLTVLMDGITLGYQAAKRSVLAQLPTREGEVDDIKTKEFLLMPERKDRVDVAALIRDGLSSGAFRALRNRLSEADNCLAGILDLCAEQTPAVNGSQPVPPAPLRNFLSTVARNSPAVGSFVDYRALESRGRLPPWVTQWHLADDLTEAMMGQMRDTFPALANLVRSYGWLQLRDRVRPVLKSLVVIGAKMVGTPAEQDEGPAPDEHAWTYAPWLSTSYNKLRRYKADSVRSYRNPEDCVKFASRAKTLTEGLLCAYCPHGICIAFSILNRFEGPSVAFELLFRRLKTGPRLIIYDNACVLHLYCIKRERAFFLRTNFRVDRMHFKGHRGCSNGYDLDHWPSTHYVISPAELEGAKAEAELAGEMWPATANPITISALNTQVCEQYNSRLRYIATTCAFMGHASFYRHIKAFMYLWNADLMARNMYRAPLDIMLSLLDKVTLPEPAQPAPRAQAAEAPAAAQAAEAAQAPAAAQAAEAAQAPAAAQAAEAPAEAAQAPARQAKRRRRAVAADAGPSVHRSLMIKRIKLLARR